MPSNQDTPSAVKSSHQVNPGAQEQQENSEAGWEQGGQLSNLGPGELGKPSGAVATGLMFIQAQGLKGLGVPA